MRPGDCKDARIVRPGDVLVLHRTEGEPTGPQPLAGRSLGDLASPCCLVGAQRARGTGRCGHPLCLVGARRRCCSHPSSPQTAQTEAGISQRSLTGTWCWTAHWPVVASRCATYAVEGLTAGLARAMTPHPRGGGGEEGYPKSSQSPCGLPKSSSEPESGS
jgi:hypothetical protein